MKFFERLNKLIPAKKGIRAVLILLFVLAIGGSIFAGIFVRNLVSGMTILNLPGEPVSVPEKTVNEEGETVIEETPKPEARVNMPDPWDGTTRVNLLFMGLDYRDWEAGEVPRTDTMILFTFDPINNKAGMISLPRDLYVSIPGFDYDKINTAYFLGETWKVPGGGPELARRTVEEFLGVPIQYYAQVDFSAFVDFIDHIDGVKIELDETIQIDPLGDNNTKVLEPGRYVLPGDLALAYARARNTEGGDFDRAKRQQQIVIGILKRITDLKLMPTLVANANVLYSDLSAGINTNLNLEDGIRLALRVLEIPREEIDLTIISGEYVTFEKSPEGLDILKPVPDKIRLLRDQVFSDGIAVGPSAITDDINELVVIENARVAINNGSSVSDLLTTTVEFLQSEGVNIVSEGNADYAVYSQVYLYGSKPYTLRYFVDFMGIAPNQIFYRYDPDAQVDIVLVLGDEWAINNPFSE